MGVTLSRLARRLNHDRNIHNQNNNETMPPPLGGAGGNTSRNGDTKGLETSVMAMTLSENGNPSKPQPPSDPRGMARILALTPVPTIVMNKDLKIVEISKGYLKLANLTRSQCIGLNIYDFASQRSNGLDFMNTQAGISSAMKNRSAQAIDGIPDKSGKAWAVRISPIYDDENTKELLYVVLEKEELQQTRPRSDKAYTNETYRILVNNVKDYAIFMLDTNGYVSTWNAGAHLLKQYTAEEIIGKHFSTFYGKEDNEAGKPQKELEICMRDGKVEDEGWRFKKDGSRFWASVTIAPVYRKGVHIGFSKVTRDLTERKAAETRLIAAFEEASKLKSDFLANMSHEIRTPMHGMLTACSLLMDTGLTSEQVELATIIRESGAILLQVINDILDYSKLASGSFTVNSTNISIGEIVRALIKASQPTLRSGVKFYRQMDKRIPKNLNSDPLRYRQVLGNLVGNATKFTESGSISIVTTLKQEERDAYIVLTEVVDTGIGVPAHAVDALFTPFAQFDSSATKQYKGTGLGLSICKSLVELMGGTIGYRANEDGVGSTFWFTTRLSKISATPSSPSATGEKNSNVSTADTETMHADENALMKQLLVVEDNLINRTIMVKLLKNYGFKHIDVAVNGQEAVNIIKAKPLTYGLILMDINMPVMDGIAATQAIRNMGLEVPIIAMTANALKGDEEEYLSIGMNDYIAKPVERRGALRTLLKWLHGGTSQWADGADSGGPETPGTGTTDREELLRRSGGRGVGDTML